jgi:stromal membrane-associated protein
LDAFLNSPSSSPAISHQASPAVSQLQGADFFFNSEATPAAPAAAAPSNTQQNQKHNDLKSSILSLYSNIPAAAPPQNYGNNMSGFQQQMAGLSMNNTSSYQQNNYQYNNGFQQQPKVNDPWGSFASASPSQAQPQSNLPQGGQFFSDNTPITPKKPERE